MPLVFNCNSAMLDSRMTEHIRLPLQDTAESVEAEYPKLIADYVLDLVLDEHYTPEQAGVLYMVLTETEC